MFGKKPLNKIKALEKIAESLIECDTPCDYGFVLGCVDMAFELGVLTFDERSFYRGKALEKYETAKKAKRECQKRKSL